MPASTGSPDETHGLKPPYPSVQQLVASGLSLPPRANRIVAGGCGLRNRADLEYRLPAKRVYLETMGCQMNVLDSELVLGQLTPLGYQPTDDFTTADVVLLNTCSVRQHAEDKVYSRLGEIKHVKKHRPEMIVGVIGCMAERDRAGIEERAGFVDLIRGPGNLNEIPALLAEAAEHRPRVVSLEQDHSRRQDPAERTLQYDSMEALDLSRTPPPDGRTLQSYIRVQRGCDKFCTFCVVPFTARAGTQPAAGAHRSRGTQARRRGAKEITLLGQTVNSYSFAEDGRTVGFAELLERVHSVDGLQRIRFVTSYPGDFTEDVLHAMATCPRSANTCTFPPRAAQTRC